MWDDPDEASVSSDDDDDDEATTAVASGKTADGENSSSWGWLSWSLIAVGLLFLVIFVFFVIYYIWQRQVAQQHPTSVGAATRKSIHAVVVTVFSLIVLLLLAVLLSLLAVIGLRKVEQKNLFQPTPLDRYTQLSGTIYSLRSGGLVLNTTPERTQARRLLFLHGNTGNLELYREALDKIAEYGYNVFAIEYRGYGPARRDVEPNATTVTEDAVEAWDLMGSPDGIVAGFSLGGAILAQVYERLIPMPAQIVFLNSFGSIKQLLQDKLGQEFGSTAAPLMATQWSIKAPTLYTGKVLVVFTADDLTVPAKHGERLCQVFSKSDLVCRELPRGGHKYSVFSYFSSWANELLPPQIS